MFNENVKEARNLQKKKKKKKSNQTVFYMHIWQIWSRSKDDIRKLSASIGEDFFGRFFCFETK